MPRTNQEISDRIASLDNTNDPGGSQRSCLISRLPHALQAPFIPDIGDEEATARPQDNVTVQAEIQQYMNFAFRRLNRGELDELSDGYFTAWCWLMGDDYDEIRGNGTKRAQLIRVCRQYGIDPNEYASEGQVIGRNG